MNCWEKWKYGWNCINAGGEYFEVDNVKKNYRLGIVFLILSEKFLNQPHTCKFM